MIYDPNAYTDSSIHHPTMTQADIDKYTSMLKNDTFVEWVPVNLIRETKYGRPLSPGRIKDMYAKAKSQDSRTLTHWFGVITLSLQADGTYTCINGNHRVKVARMLEIPTMRAEVLIDLTRDEETILYEIIHTVSLPSALDRFRSRVYRGEPAALDIVRILDKYGLMIATYTGPSKDDAVQAVAALDAIYSDYGSVFLDDVISLLHGAWGVTNRRAYLNSMLRGMAAFWVRFRTTADRHRMQDVLSKRTPEQIIALSTAPTGTGAIEAPATRFGKTFYRVYMFGLRQGSKAHLGEWIERPGSMFRDARIGATGENLKPDDYQTARTKRSKIRQRRQEVRNQHQGEKQQAEMNAKGD